MHKRLKYAKKKKKNPVKVQTLAFSKEPDMVKHPGNHSCLMGEHWLLNQAQHSLAAYP